MNFYKIIFTLKAHLKKTFPIACIVFKHYQNYYELCRSGYVKSANLIFKKTGGRVHGGPFAGMHYRPKAAGSALIPKILGCYEQELHPWVAQLLDSDYTVIIDIGCAEGYYAVGFALRSKSHAVIYAYDINPVARRMCRRMAELNKVADRIRIQGACLPAALAANIRKPTLIICDCEGSEATILDPFYAPDLCFCDMLVETHGNTREVLVGRFSKTHAISEVVSAPRDINQYPLLNSLCVAERTMAIDEGRGLVPQYWLLFRPRAKAPG